MTAGVVKGGFVRREWFQTCGVFKLQFLLWSNCNYNLLNSVFVTLMALSILGSKKGSGHSTEHWPVITCAD